MLPILGVPIIERIISDIAACGVHDFIVIANPQDDELINHFQGAAYLDAGVQIVHQTEPRGMAHALSCAAPHIRGDFLLAACDNLVPLESLSQMLHLWQTERGLVALLALMRVTPKQASGSGIVELNGDWVKHIVEKPPSHVISSRIASMPLYCFTPRLLNFLPEVKCSPRGEYELQDAIQMLIEKEGRVRGLVLPARMTLTTPADLLPINRHYLLEKQANGEPLQVESDNIGTNTQLVDPLWIGKGTSIGASCTIGPLVYIEGDCTIGDHINLLESVVLRGTTIPNEADIAGSVLFP